MARLLGAAGLGGFGMLAGVGSAFGQPASQPTRTPGRPNAERQRPAPTTPGAPKSFLEDVITKGRTRNWTLKTFLQVQSYQTPINQMPADKMPTILAFKFTTAAIVLPISPASAGCEPNMKSLQSDLRMDQRTIEAKPQIGENYPAGTRLARWEMRNGEGRLVSLDTQIALTTWEVAFDEAKAAKATWPAGNKWPKVPQSTFAPQKWVESSSPVVAEAVRQWTEGKPPQAVSPVQLAKHFLGKVVETIQISGDGLVSGRTGMLQGFDLKGAEQTLRDKRGSEHDMACVLCAVYRNAGLPARTVIGLDVTESKGQDSVLGGKKKGDRLRSWVEFCLYDESTGKELWVPVDPARQRGNSSRVPAFDRPWKYFGNNDDLDDVLPIAFQYHPPTTVIAHGSPCFWGWLTTPELQFAEQSMRWLTATTPIRPDNEDSKKKGPYK